jgi:hypothetical protein
MKDKIMYAIQNADPKNPVCDVFAKQVEVTCGLVVWGAEELKDARFLTTRELGDFFSIRANIEAQGVRLTTIRILTVRVEEFPPVTPTYKHTIL